VIIHPQRTRLRENFSANPAVQQLLQKREGIIEFVNQDGVPIVAAFAPIEQTGWGVVVRQPASETYAYAKHILVILSLVFLFSLTAAAGLGIYLAHKIARPVTTLVQGVKKVTAGDMTIRIPETGQDEIGELAAAFNEMTQRLQKHLDEIQAAHERVLQAQTQLARSERLAAVGQLAAGLAHEINNPLNIISGFNELLREQTPEGDTRRAHLEEICRETVRCQKLVSDLLYFAKPKEPERAPTDVGRLAADTLNLLQSRAKAQGIEAESQADAGLPRLRVDADQLKQALLNLLINACQAMPDGGRLSVKARRLPRHVEIRVEDTGKGIAPEDLGRIFNPFFTTKEEGTGLGLPLSYALVERHGGTIQAHSEKGRGSVFTILLPIPEEHDGKTA
jgi:signal transduction histidine kinase